ncbi:MAG: tetratricopeptide repeat protein [Candidatus Binataceae bacterium]
MPRIRTTPARMWHPIMWRDRSEFFERTLLAVSLLVGATLLFMLYQRDANWARCGGAAPDTRIRACTAVINSGFEFAASLSRAYSNRGAAYRRKGDREHALDDYDEAVRLSPTNSRALHNRGVIYGEQELYELALEDFDNAIRIEPGYANAWNARCWTKVIMGRERDAVNDCTRSLNLHAADPVTLRSRALAFLKLGEPGRAIADYDASLNFDPRNASALFGRGIAKQMQRSGSGASDMTAAANINAAVVHEFEKYGVSAGGGAPANAVH